MPSLLVVLASTRPNRAGAAVTDWVVDRAANQIRRLKELGLRVVGDLEELRPVPSTGADPSEVSASAQLEAAIDALRYLVEVWPSP